MTEAGRQALLDYMGAKTTDPACRAVAPSTRTVDHIQTGMRA